MSAPDEGSFWYIPQPNMVIIIGLAIVLILYHVILMDAQNV